MDPSDAVQRPPMYEALDSLKHSVLLKDWDESGVPASFVVVFCTEVGDKTFFLAMLLAMRHGKLAVFFGTMGALFIMTASSALVGFLVASSADLLESSVGVMDVCATILFGIFGTQLLLEAYALHKKEANEAEMRSLLGGEGTPTHGERMDAEETLRQSDETDGKVRTWWGAVWQTFTMMFVAEWGDRSMFATVALATQHNIVGVIIGAMAAHVLANLMAVVGGEMLSNVISEKVMAFTGGCVFIVFACISLWEAIMHEDIMSLAR
uniref:GDT1 family protein n=1 Tax=Mantoniella antarctica TaxID=81844 RepID=A0A7S0T4X3_9CHLO|mmetsp:Transcript_929/g.2126  ORF Transcript_929/g.2126 Transcript_929/m.2126 type:complete len:266 (+) Transcript_929:279-1076(+)